MPPLKLSGEVQQPGWLTRSQTFIELKRSVLLHANRPLSLAVVISGGLLQFGVETWAGAPAPVPADLAGMFAVPQLDSFTWVHSAVGLLPVIVLVLIRVVVVWLFVCLVLGIAPAAGNLIRTSGAYLLTVFTFAVLFAALAWLGPILANYLASFFGDPAGGDPYLAGSRLALGIVFYFVFFPSLSVLAVAMSPLPARAAAGSDLKVSFRQPSIWVLVCLSTLLYLTVVLPGQQGNHVSSAGFLLAFVVLTLQSLIYAAIVRLSGGSAVVRRLAS